MDPASLGLFVVLFFLSAFFSGSEIAFMSIPSHTVDSLVKKRKFGARTLKFLKKNTERLLITILIGNNLINVFTSAYATKISIDIAESSGLQESLAIGIATGAITFMLLLFGEIMPKTFATRYAIPLSLSVSKIYYWLQIVLKPAIIVIEGIMRLFKSKKGDQLVSITTEEIESLVELGKNQGTFDEVNYKLIRNILKFEGITIEEVMTPRVKLEAIEANQTVDEALEKVLSFSHSRIPVYVKRIDNIERVITLRELVNLKNKGKGDQKLCNLALEKVYKAPLTQPIDRMLETFKHKRRHIAVVMDEYGGVAGLVTLEDLIETVFGDFVDETDREIKSIQEIKDGFIMQADITIDEMLAEIDIDYHDAGINEKEFGSETISYFITSQLERFPEKGEQVSIIIQKDNKAKDDEEKNKPDEVIIQVKNATEDTIKAVKVVKKFTIQSI